MKKLETIACQQIFDTQHTRGNLAVNFGTPIELSKEEIIPKNILWEKILDQRVVTSLEILASILLMD